MNHILCLLQPFFSSKSQSLAFRKEWNNKSSNADLKKKYIQCFKFKLSFWKKVLSNVCLGNLIFAGSFYYFKPVSCWILFCENFTGVPEPFDQLPSYMRKVNTFNTIETRLYFDSDIWGRCLTIIFVGSFPYFKFLTKINS